MYWCLRSWRLEAPDQCIGYKLFSFLNHVQSYGTHVHKKLKWDYTKLMVPGAMMAQKVNLAVFGCKLPYGIER